MPSSSYLHSGQPRKGLTQVAHSIGLNLPADGSIPAERLAQALPEGAWVRIVLTPEHDLRSYFRELLDQGLWILAVIARESLNGDLWSPDEAAAHYVGQYGGLVDAIQVGNEWDHESPSSWTMTHGDLNKLVEAFHKARAATFGAWKLILGGAASGNPEMLRGVRLWMLDGIAIHPYGQRPAPNWPNSSWGFGYYENLVQRYAAVAKSIVGRDLPVWITEVGLSEDIASDSLQSEYLSRMVGSWLSPSDDLVKVPRGAMILFTAHNYQGFGILDEPEEAALIQALVGVSLPLVENGGVPGAEFVMGFKKLADRLGPDVVGQPLENQDYITTKLGGELAIQFTTTGVMLYSKQADREHFFPGR